MTPAWGPEVTWKLAYLLWALEMSRRYSCFLSHHHAYKWYSTVKMDPQILSSLSQTEKRGSNEEQDDIESNLLVPAGVTMRWATLNLKVYRAEDMPQSKKYPQNLYLYSQIQPRNFHLKVLCCSGRCFCSDDEASLWRGRRQEKLSWSIFGSQLCRKEGISCSSKFINVSSHLQS